MKWERREGASAEKAGAQTPHPNALPAANKRIERRMVLALLGEGVERRRGEGASADKLKLGLQTKRKREGMIFSFRAIRIGVGSV